MNKETKPKEYTMKKYTRKQFAGREDNLRKMRRNNPIQFEVLFVDYCRIKGFQYITGRI